jgi:hypothetical protein
MRLALDQYESVLIVDFLHRYVAVQHGPSGRKAGPRKARLRWRVGLGARNEVAGQYGGGRCFRPFTRRGGEPGALLPMHSGPQTAQATRSPGCRWRSGRRLPGQRSGSTGGRGRLRRLRLRFTPRRVARGSDHSGFGPSPRNPLVSTTHESMAVGRCHAIARSDAMRSALMARKSQNLFATLSWVKWHRYPRGRIARNRRIRCTLNKYRSATK